MTDNEQGVPLPDLEMQNNPNLQGQTASYAPQ